MKSAAFQSFVVELFIRKEIIWVGWSIDKQCFECAMYKN